MQMFPGDPNSKTQRYIQVSEPDSAQFAFGTERTELTLELRTGKGLRLLAGHSLPGAQGAGGDGGEHRGGESAGEPLGVCGVNRAASRRAAFTLQHFSTSRHLDTYSVRGGMSE